MWSGGNIAAARLVCVEIRKLLWLIQTHMLLISSAQDCRYMTVKTRQKKVTVKRYTLFWPEANLSLPPPPPCIVSAPVWCDKSSKQHPLMIFSFVESLSRWDDKGNDSLGMEKILSVGDYFLFHPERWQLHKDAIVENKTVITTFIICILVSYYYCLIFLSLYVHLLCTCV